MDAKQRHDDEAGRIRRWSPGPSQQAHDNGSNANANASIGGSFWIALVAVIGVVAVGILAGYALGVGQARAETMQAEVRRLNAKVEVLQWEFDKASAQLIQQGLITKPE